MTRKIQRRGFTLLELLAVIGIILILVSMAILAYKHVDAAGTQKATIAYLENAKALLTEYEVSTPITSGRDVNGKVTGGLIDATGNPTASSPAWPTIQPVPAPKDVNVGGADRNTSATLATTEAIMQQLSRIPKNKEMLSQIPGKLTMLDASGMPMAFNGAPVTVMLDGWKNPIIYVPAGGMSGVTLNGGPRPQIKTVVAVDGRPFFASAGADGNFAQGDDNLYSSQVRYIP